MSLACPEAAHDALKRDPLAWSTLPYLGRLDDARLPLIVELRNCTDCHTTLGAMRERCHCSACGVAHLPSVCPELGGEGG